MKTTLQLLILGAGLSAAGFDDGFAPYQTIIDRMPFGRPPAESARAQASDGPDASGPEGADGLDENDPEYEKAAARIRACVRVSAVNVPPGGEPVVGFTDTSHTPPRNHLLAQGQSADGWTVVKIDAPARRTVLSREGVSVSLPLGANLGADASKRASPSRK